jgi:Bifunctional DNA primase/polymerase, N-terminal
VDITRRKRRPKHILTEELPQQQSIDLQDYNKWADYWRYDMGVNVMPADTKNKKTLIPWREWQNKPIPEEVHDKWKSENAFSKGMAIIPGKVWHKQAEIGLYLTFIDLDTKNAIDEFCTSNGKTTSLQKMAQEFIVEQHKDDPSRAHIYFYSPIPFVRKSADDVIGLEVKGLGGHGIAYCSPSIHKDGQPYEIIGTTTPVTLTADQAKEFMQHIDSICKKYSVEYIDKHYKNLLDSDFKIYQGSRHDSMISIANSILFRYDGDGGKSQEELKEIYNSINSS